MAFKDSCHTLAKVAPNEPIFVLRAQDQSAPDIVRVWAQRAAFYLGNSHEKIVEANRLADEMMEWQRNHFTKHPD